MEENDLVLVDSHVHYYPFCTYSEFFATALINMSMWAKRLNHYCTFTGIICLSNTRNNHSFLELREIAKENGDLGEWNVNIVGNADLLRAQDNQNREIIIVPGTQVITSENIEVLVIGTSENIPHDKPALSYIEKFSRDKLVILPWGVGKWLGKRGRLVSDIITSMTQFEFALGDNSGRPSIWSHVPQFEQARCRGVNVLPGSDPLPLKGQYKKVGNYGVAFSGSISANGLVPLLRQKLLSSQDSQVIRYGSVDSLWQFLYGQMLLRLWRR